MWLLRFSNIIGDLAKLFNYFTLVMNTNKKKAKLHTTKVRTSWACPYCKASENKSQNMIKNKSNVFLSKLAPWLHINTILTLRFSNILGDVVKLFNYFKQLIITTIKNFIYLQLIDYLVKHDRVASHQTSSTRNWYNTRVTLL